MELFLFFAGCFTFPSLYFLSIKFLSSIMPDKPKEFYLGISTRVVSLIQAVCASCVGLRVVLTCDNIMKDRYESVYNYAWFGLSYFYYDVGAMFLEAYHRYSTKKLDFLVICQQFLSNKCLVVCHHVFLPIFGFPIIVYFRHGIGDFFVGCIFMAEMSTPFLSIEAILRRFEMKESLLYRVNGIVLAVAYFICRILIFPYMYWSYARHAKQPIWEVPFKIPWFCNLSCLALLSLQMVWFLVMLKHALRVLTLNKSKAPSEQNGVKVRLA